MGSSKKEPISRLQGDLLRWLVSLSGGHSSRHPTKETSSVLPGTSSKTTVHHQQEILEWSPETSHADDFRSRL